MKSMFFVAASVVTVAVLRKADGISGTVYCYADDFLAGAGSAVGCPASYGLSSASAGFSGSITPNSVAISGSAFARAFPGPGRADAFVSASGSLSLYTLGPIRPGFIVFNYYQCGLRAKTDSITMVGQHSGG